MAMQKHEISLRVLKNISRVSAPFELFYDDNLKLRDATQRHFVVVECYVVKLLSCVA